MERYKVLEASLLPANFPDTWPEPLIEVVKAADAQATVEALRSELDLTQTAHAQTMRWWDEAKQQVEALQRERDALFSPAHATPPPWPAASSLQVQPQKL